MGRPQLPVRLGNDRSGQSNPIAVILIAAVTVIGTGVIVTLGATAFAETKNSASLSLNEQSMAKFDSETATVAFGESPSRSVSLGGAGGGVYEVRQESSWLRVVHRNFTGSTPVRNETIYNESIGSFVYETDETTIAYEGGGVWRTEGERTKMVSPPEFRYRGATLTLPIIQIEGEGAAGGSPQSRISRTGMDRVFTAPTTSNPPGGEVGPPYNHTDDPYRNPIQNGRMTVTVHSPHYRGWAEYFRTRTAGSVDVDHDATEVTVELTTLDAPVGEFSMPGESGQITVPAAPSGHDTNEFKLRLTADNHFNNGHWELYYDDTREFGVHVKSNGQCTGGTYSSTVKLTVYYDANPSDGVYQGWQRTYDPDTADTVSVYCGGGAPAASISDRQLRATIDSESAAVAGGRTALLGMGPGPDPVMLVNLTSPDDISYGTPVVTGSQNKFQFNPDIASESLRDPHDPDAHPEDDEGVLTPGKTRTVNWVTNHYFASLGTQFTLTVSDGPGGSSRVDESASSGDLDYEPSAGGEYVTYVHITENRVEVDVAA